MSKTKRLLTKIGDGFKAVGRKVSETYDSAATGLRAKGLEARIEEQYENLGRIVYRDLHTEEDLEDMKLEIIAKIDALFDELEEIKAAKRAKRAAKAAEAAAASETACAEESAAEPAAEEDEKTEEK